MPEAGESWKTRISADAVTDTLEQGYQEWSGKLDTVFAFLPAIEAKPSGCTIAQSRSRRPFWATVAASPGAGSISRTLVSGWKPGATARVSG